jgi:hypothetical protein
MNPPDRTVIYRVSRNGHVMGEYDIDRIVELLDVGEFLWTDLYWGQGMAGWSPMTNLRSEVLAAKTFPPVVAASRPAASGRRGMAPGGAPVSAPAASGVAGWWWVLGAVVVGALAGLTTTHFFPTIVVVDRPVDKIVEKIVEKPVEVVRTVEKVVDRPVEVVRMVDKIVEVPTALTPEQQEALVLVERLHDPKRRTVGVGLFKVSEKVKILYDVEGAGSGHLNSGAIVSRVESAFRGHGFTVLPRDYKGSPYTIVTISGLFLEDTNSNGIVMSISGGYRITVSQPGLVLNPFDKAPSSSREIKIGLVDLYSRSGSIDYGSSNFYKVPDVFARVAEDCAKELRKAQDN